MYISIYVSEKGLLSGIYKTLLQIYEKKKENSIEKEVHGKDISKEKIWKQKINMKRHSISLVIGEMQINIIKQIPQHTLQMVKMGKTDNIEQSDLLYSDFKLL